MRGVAAAGPDLDELRGDAVRAVTIVLLAAGVYLLLLIAAQPSRWQHEPVPALTLTVCTLILSSVLHSRGVRLSTAALLAGTATTITVALYTLQSGLFASAYSAVVLVAAMLLGWRYAIGIGVVEAGIVLYSAGQIPQVVSPGIVEMTLLTISGNLVLSWLLSRPFYTALSWYWSSYRLAEEKTAEARARQAELVRLSSNLQDACVRLEAANEELERARRAAVEARQAKADFAAAISHELRTPLNLIIGFSEMMVIAPHTYQGERLPDGYRGDVEAIYRNACHLSSLVDDVLDLAQVEAHRMALEKEWVALDSVVDEAIATVATLYQDRGLSLRSEVAPNLPRLYVDRTRIRQVLINLLNNAARFTVSGGTTIGVELRDDEVVVSVEDTGVGIPAEELPTIFKEYHRSGDPKPGPFGGRGLGLAICRRFIELHGGSIWVESAPGRGSKFEFSLPFNPSFVGASAREEWETWARLPSAQPEPVVAVLSPDEPVAEVFRRYLDGFRVERVGSVERARYLAGRYPLRALILPTPPSERSAEPLPQLPGLRGVPVVFCPLRTRANANPDLRVLRYLVKPVDREELRAALAPLGRKPLDIVVVDDDPEMIRLLHRMLRSLSRRYRIASASSGAEALDLFRAMRPDVVLLDLLMPDVDGYQIIEVMKQDALLSDVPVIVITARGTEDELVTADELTIRRPGGLSVGEVMGCLRAVLGAVNRSALRGPTGAPAE